MLDGDQRKPVEWLPADGTAWLTRDDVGGDGAEIIMHFAKCLQALMWQGAAKHRHGAGQGDEYGTCCTAVRKAVKAIARCGERDGLAMLVLALVLART